MPSNVTYLEIDLRALLHNYKVIRSKLSPYTRLLAVVKAFSYGHEDVSMAKALEAHGVDYLAVAYLQEGIRLRKAGVRTPVLVLHPQDVDKELYVDYNLEPAIYSENIFRAFVPVLKASSLPVHLKFNTGLNRLGFNKSDIPGLKDLIRENGIGIASVFSHLAASEDPAEKDFTLTQIERYEEIVAGIGEGYEGEFIRHLCNTSGVFNYPEAHYDMVRVGIGLYGFSNDEHRDYGLQPVGRLISRISQIHHVKKGDSVGYNRAYIAPANMRSATIPIGHADGISRAWGKGKGYFTIHGKKAPVIGNVCMDMTMVDVSDIDCKEGDEVLIFDRQDIVEDIAGRTGTISYELITGISRRVKRKIIKP